MDEAAHEAAREAAAERDAADSLAAFRDRFFLPEGTLYLDGNSLGPLSDAAAASLDRVVDEWKESLVEGWTDAEPPWFYFGERLGDELAPLVGAAPDEVAVANSTTVNIHTLVGTFYDELLAGRGPEGSETEGIPDGRERKDVPDASETEDVPDVPAVLVNELDFPTDHYAIRAQLRQRGVDPEEKLRVVESDDGRTIALADVEAALETHDDVGIVFMPTALYRSGQLFDVERITRVAHEHGAYAGFDAAHTVGAVDHEFSDHEVDFAVWCSYKYLNAGPGAIAGLYVNERHFGLTPALAGWWGHEKATQFEMNPTYTPEESAGAWQIGTIPVLSAAPLEGSLELVHEAGVGALREKSLALTDLLIDLVDAELPEFSVGTPREPTCRGGHVALEHPEAYRLTRALSDRGVIVDYRPPNVLRVCPAPLYTSYTDVVDVVSTLRDIVDSDAYEQYDAYTSGVS